MLEKGLKPDLNTYNEMIKLVRFQHGKSVQDKSAYIMEMLTHIKNDGMTPNLRTFNNALTTVASFGIDQNSVVFALNILKEMEFLKIGMSIISETESLGSLLVKYIKVACFVRAKLGNMEQCSGNILSRKECRRQHEYSATDY